jgi:hypothetical protein
LPHCFVAANLLFLPKKFNTQISVSDSVNKIK